HQPQNNDPERSPRLSGRLSGKVQLQPLQVGPNLRCMLIAQVAILFEALMDDALPFLGQGRIETLGRRRIAIENAIENHSRALPRKWQRARRHLIQDYSKAEQIRA